MLQCKPGKITLHQRLLISYFTFCALLLSGNSMAVEEAKYTVLREDDRFELRKYEPHILAETIVDEQFEEAGNAAFQRLFSYIRGNNKQKQKVSMTSPVGQEPVGQKIAMTSPVGQQEQDGNWVVSFMLPASFTLENTPAPLDPRISIRQVHARHMAAVRYSGFWSEKNYLKHLEQLQNWIDTQGLTPAGEPQWARYDPPFMPWFLRRNEILIPVHPPAPRDQ